MLHGWVVFALPSRMSKRPIQLLSITDSHDEMVIPFRFIYVRSAFAGIDRGLLAVAYTAMHEYLR
jgi:hypothetical protein